MFIIRWLKKLLILALIVLAAVWFLQNTSTGQKAKNSVIGFLKSELFKEGVKDLKVLTGEALKGVGERLQEGETPEEQKKLDDLFKEKLAKEPGGPSAGGKSQLEGTIKTGKTGLVPSDSKSAGEIKGGIEKPKTTMAKPIQIKKGGE